MTIDAVILSIDAIGKATGIGTFDYHPLSKYGQAIDASGANTTTALVALVNGFADEWSDAIERAKHGDYRGLTDVSIDTLVLIEGARTGGAIALDKVAAATAKVGRVANAARARAAGLHAEIRDVAAAMADGAGAFLARLRAGGMQTSTAGGGGQGPSLGGLSSDVLADAAQAAKEAFKDKRAAQEAATKGDTRPSAEHPATSAENVGQSQTAGQENHPTPLERKPFRTREGALVEAVEQGRAVVPTGKVEFYPRGKAKPFTKEMAQELKSLKNERQTNRKEFDKDPSKATRIKKLEDLKHNYDRSIEMAKSLDGAGLPDTAAVNEDIIRHLLEVGQNINQSNRVQFRSQLSGSARNVKLLSTWAILPDGRAFLSTIMVIPQ